MELQLLSIQVGLPQTLPRGTRSGIAKQPVAGPVQLHLDHLEGDGQADRRHHGGPDKAVYAYGQQHYVTWQQELARTLPPAAFGENLSIAGLDEQRLGVGDELVIGQVRLQVSQPRIPCFKLGLHLGDPEMPRRFIAAARPGAYLRVLQPGMLQAGQPVQWRRDGASIPLKPLFQAYMQPRQPGALAVLQRALAHPALSAEWREALAKRLPHDTAGR